VSSQDHKGNAKLAQQIRYVHTVTFPQANVEQSAVRSPLQDVPQSTLRSVSRTNDSKSVVRQEVRQALGNYEVVLDDEDAFGMQTCPREPRIDDGLVRGKAEAGAWQCRCTRYRER
jgi:hypothetical protein